MNFLAHLSLSGTNPDVMIGNLIGDFVKGRASLHTFDPAIVKGIELHRGIDLYTDHHPVVQQSKNRLRPKYNHYAGVIVDMFYDHLLAANWDLYYPESLPDFADRVYRRIQGYEPVLPERARTLLPHMIRGNWLVNYAKVEGIHRALSGMAQRSEHESKMGDAAGDLTLSYKEFSAEFHQFFPDLQRWASGWLAERA